MYKGTAKQTMALLPLLLWQKVSGSQTCPPKGSVVDSIIKLCECECAASAESSPATTAEAAEAATAAHRSRSRSPAGQKTYPLVI